MKKTNKEKYKEIKYKCSDCGKTGNYLEFDNENSENFEEGNKCICRDCSEDK